MFPPHKVLLFETIFCFWNFNFNFNLILILFYHLTLNLLVIEFYNLFQLIFYKVIWVSWTKSKVLWVNLVDLVFLSFLVINFFFNFIFHHLGWLRIKLHNLY
jgi:hypothetical protein